MDQAHKSLGFPTTNGSSCTLSTFALLPSFNTLVAINKALSVGHIYAINPILDQLKMFIPSSPHLLFSTLLLARAAIASPAAPFEDAGPKLLLSRQTGRPLDCPTEVPGTQTCDQAGFCYDPALRICCGRGNGGGSPSPSRPIFFAAGPHTNRCHSHLRNWYLLHSRGLLPNCKSPESPTP